MESRILDKNFVEEFGKYIEATGRKVGCAKRAFTAFSAYFGDKQVTVRDVARLSHFECNGIKNLGEDLVNVIREFLTANDLDFGYIDEMAVIAAKTVDIIGRLIARQEQALSVYDRIIEEKKDASTNRDIEDLLSFGKLREQCASTLALLTTTLVTRK